jgi:cytochrome c
MDSFEFNKIAGAVLSAALVAFGAGTMGEIFGGGGHGDGHAKPGYELPKVAAVATAGAAPVAFEFAKVSGLLKTASVESGQAVFKSCTACHTPDKDGKAGTGPNLWGIIGRPVGSSATFTRYSPAMKGKGGTWSFASLGTYLNDPRSAIPGNQMAFAGIKSNEDLADVLAYLRSLSDKPADLP